MLAPARLPPGQRIYAVGDVHGCATRLAAMHQLIAEDLARRPVLHSLVAHLGDYIDRGDDSAGVIDLLLAPFPAAPGHPRPLVVNLLGNHEAMFLGAMSGDQQFCASWLVNGGAATLASWGIPDYEDPAHWHAAIPPRHLGFLRSLGTLYRAGGYIFVHAGLRPGLPLEAQSRTDMLWIREPFLSFEGKLPGVVVHGHTPEPAPVVRPNRIGVDTGAVLGGVLTCAVLEANAVAFLTA